MHEMRPTTLRMPKAGSLLLLTFALAVALAACASETPVPSDPAATYDTYGAAFEPQDALPVQAVVAEPAEYVGKTVRVEGVVREVCQQAGCWLTLDAGDNGGAAAPLVRIRVARNEDGSYVFTVPKDISGRRVVVEGTIDEGTLSAEEQRHLAEDAGTADADADTAAAAPVTEYQVTASGVLVEKART